MPIIYTKDLSLDNLHRNSFIIERARPTAALVPQSDLISQLQAPLLLSPELYLWEGGQSKDKGVEGMVLG